MIKMSSFSFINARRFEMLKGKCTCVSIANEVLERIKMNNPDLNCISQTNPTLISEAQKLDDLLHSTPISFESVEYPLLGVPILLKENIVTSTQPTSAGVFALRDFQTDPDKGNATLVDKLKSAGALIIGKAWMPDFADYMSSTMPSGFSSALQGYIIHPYSKGNLKRYDKPKKEFILSEPLNDGEIQYERGGGSSTGVACGVSAESGFGIICGIGTETQNSIQAPVCNTGLVGIKPTLGLVSRHGIVPLAISQDTAGPIARSVYDAAIILNVISGVDIKGDSITIASCGKLIQDYTSYCCVPKGKNITIGIPRDFSLWREKEAYSEHCEIIDKVLRDIKGASANSNLVFVDNLTIPTANEVSDLGSSVFRTDFKEGLNTFLTEWSSPGANSLIRSMNDVVEFNRSNLSAIPFGMNLLEAANATTGWEADFKTNASYHADRSRDLVLSQEQGIDYCLKENKTVDVLMCPMDRAAKLLGKAGYPAVSVPLGKKYRTSKGEAVGVTFFGTAWSEDKLIQAAWLFEKSLQTLL